MRINSLLWRQPSFKSFGAHAEYESDFLSGGNRIRTQLKTQLMARYAGSLHPVYREFLASGAQPYIDEQRRIAAILDKADAIRPKREQVLSTGG